MRSINRNSLTAMLLAATMAGCSTTGDPVNETESTSTAPVATETSSDSSFTTAVAETAAPEVRDAANELLGTRVFYFEFDKSNIDPDAYNALKAHAAYLANTSGAKVRLEGHADERGTREYNVALGERRGNAVAKFLRINGVSSSQIEVISYGEEKPAAIGTSESSYAQNRRVEVVYSAGNP